MLASYALFFASIMVAPAETLIPPQVPHHLELDGEIAFLEWVG
ncbi:MAG: hypothetical protein ACK4IC_02255 [Erythrobacter sp.]